MKNNFEYQINKLIEVINKSGKGFGWQNHPDRLHNGKYISGECFDYIILSKDYKCCFDAKETTQDKWVMKAKDIKQADNLYNCSLHGMDCFFLIYFYSNRNYLKLPIRLMYDKGILRKKTYYPKDMIVFNLEKMFFP